MALSIRSPRVEYLARELARISGATMTEVIERALESRIEESGDRAAERAKELAAIARRCAAAPDLDRRPADEILGYDETGAFGRGSR